MSVYSHQEKTQIDVDFAIFMSSNSNSDRAARQTCFMRLYAARIVSY